MGALDGVGVLVTRPRNQAAGLCAALAAQGANIRQLAAIEITPLADADRLAAQTDRVGEADLVIFTSANAVRFGAALLRGREVALAAIGPSTARALREAGHRIAIEPAVGFDSEHLLADPRLRDPRGARIAIIKGVDGRELLAHELAARGAQVHAVEVYRRERAKPAPAELAAVTAAISAGELNVVTATSLELASALLDLSPPPLRSALASIHWLVAGARVAAGLERLGLGARRIVADSALDQSLVEALLRWRASASGA